MSQKIERLPLAAACEKPHVFITMGCCSHLANTITFITANTIEFFI